MSPTWSGCADAALIRGDSLTATAPPCAGWLLIEHPGPWPRDAFAGSGIDADVRRALAAAARTAAYRILLIRRPGRAAATSTSRDRTAAAPEARATAGARAPLGGASSAEGDPAQPRKGRRWAVVRAGTPGAVVWGTWVADTDLLDAVARLRAVGGPQTAGPDEPATAAEPGTAAVKEPLLLVCAHGLHDTCCAVRGRPVAAALQVAWPSAVWECSHLGGDRFAANLLVLPDGTYYGQVTPESVVDLATAHIAGMVSLDQWRGSATMPPVAQAAAAALHRLAGPWGPGDVRVLEVRSAGARGPWHVDLDSPIGRRHARVSARSCPPALLTCQALAETSALEYVVTWPDHTGSRCS